MRDGGRGRPLFLPEFLSLTRLRPRRLTLRSDFFPIFSPWGFNSVPCTRLHFTTCPPQPRPCGTSLPCITITGFLMFIIIHNYYYYYYYDHYYNLLLSENKERVITNNLSNVEACLHLKPTPTNTQHFVHEKNIR